MAIELTTSSESLRKDISKTLPLWAPYANYFDFASDATTAITTKNVWVKLNCTTQVGFNRDGLVHSNNRITNTAEASVFQAIGIISLSSSPNVELHVAFFKNGELWPCSEQDDTTATGGKSISIPFKCLVELDTDDYIEVYVKNVTSTSDITIDNVNVSLIKL